MNEERHEPAAVFYDAFVSALAEMENVGKDATNPYFRSKYATLAAVMNEARPALGKYGLAVIQLVRAGYAEGHVVLAVETRIVHKSGEFLAEILSLPVEKKVGKAAEPDVAVSGIPTPQNIGSAISYFRRYALMAMLGLSGEEDDEGEPARAKEASLQQKKSKEPAPSEEPASPKATPPSKELVAAREELVEAIKSEEITAIEREAFKTQISVEWAGLSAEEVKKYATKWKTLAAERRTKALQSASANAASSSPGSAAHEYSPPAETGNPMIDAEGLF